MQYVDQHLQTSPGDRVYDVWTQAAVTVVAGAQLDTHVTVVMPDRTVVAINRRDVLALDTRSLAERTDLTPLPRNARGHFLPRS
jgi:hypothetical protein